MKNNKLIIYKNGIFNKICNFLKNIFSKKKVLSSEIVKVNNYNNDSFIQNIQIKENKEKSRLIQLKQQYEQGEIGEEDLSAEEIDKLCELYEKETEELNADTERRKYHIAQMLKELKNS